MSICNNENYYSSKNRQEFLLKGKTRHTLHCNYGLIL